MTDVKFQSRYRREGPAKGSHACVCSAPSVYFSFKVLISNTARYYHVMFMRGTPYYQRILLFINIYVCKYASLYELI